MSELLQHIAVTIVAAGACALVVRRIIGVLDTKAPQCASCPSSKPAAPAASTKVIPLSALRTTRPRL